jgi:hypothetical protein
MVAVAESMWFAQAGVTNNTDSPNIAYKIAEDRRDIMVCSFWVERDCWLRLQQSQEAGEAFVIDSSSIGGRSASEMTLREL